jgi:predicted 3-demethylubiquinone-9 3-methyltransferase (glyoxalase superfamily)
MSKVNQVVTCLWFDRDGEEAANFYVSLIPNSRITGLSRYGEGSPIPAGTALIVTFELAGTPYMILNGGPMYQLSEAASLMVYCEDQAEVDRLWSALTADGGKEVQCGWLKDKFGVFWQIVPTRLMEMMTSSDEVRKARAFTEMTKMVKLDIAKLEAAWNG